MFSIVRDNFNNSAVTVLPSDSTTSSDEAFFVIPNRRHHRSVPSIPKEEEQSAVVLVRKTPQSESVLLKIQLLAPRDSWCEVRVSNS